MSCVPGGGRFAAAAGAAASAPPAGPISVAIYDDHVLSRTGLSALLPGSEIVVAGAADADPLQLEGPGGPLPADLYLVAAAGRGSELARRLTAEHRVPVLLITQPADEPAGLLAMLDTGAAGAVCRECAPERVVTAIRAIAAGEPLPRCAHASHPASLRAPRLSEREQAVATELARGMQTEDIAESLCISPHTVRTHIRNIRRKLGARTAAHAVALALARDSVPASRAA